MQNGKRDISIATCSTLLAALRFCASKRRFWAPKKQALESPRLSIAQPKKPLRAGAPLLITKALDGFQPIDQWYASNDRVQYGEALHERVLEQVAHTLARLHTARWQHGCIYIKHILVRISGEGQAITVEVALLDLEKCRGRLTIKQAGLHDMLQLRRHSPWDQTDWQTLIGHYQRAMGRPFKTLYTATRR
jgi:hypothetical protein